MRRDVLRVIAPVVVAAVLAAMTLTPATAGTAGRAAPPFRLELFSGKTVALSDLKGTAVVLLFWTPW